MNYACKSKPPKLYRQIYLSKKCETYLNNMLVFSFFYPILFRSMWACNPMNNAMLCKKRCERAIFNTPITLKLLNVSLKMSFNQLMELNKTIDCLRFTLNEKNNLSLDVLNQAIERVELKIHVISSSEL